MRDSQGDRLSYFTTTFPISQQTLSHVIHDSRPSQLQILLVFDRIGGYRKASTLTSKFYFRLAKLLRRREEEKMRSDDQEKEDIDGTGKVEHYASKKDSRRRHMHMIEQKPTGNRERNHREGVCQWVARHFMSCAHGKITQRLTEGFPTSHASVSSQRSQPRTFSSEICTTFYHQPTGSPSSKNTPGCTLPRMHIERSTSKCIHRPSAPHRTLNQSSTNTRK